MRFLCIFLACAVQACVNGGDREIGRLDPLGPNGFQYVESSSVLHPLDDEQAEHGRLARLAQAVEEARLCPGGYRIIERAPPMAYGHEKWRRERVVTPVTYAGECTSDAHP